MHGKWTWLGVIGAVGLGATAALFAGGSAGAAPPPPWFDNLTLRNVCGMDASDVSVKFYRSAPPAHTQIEDDPFRIVELGDLSDQAMVTAMAGEHGVAKIVVTATVGGVTKSCLVTADQVSAWPLNPPYEYTGICNQAPKQVDGCPVNQSNFPATFEIRPADAAHNNYPWCRLVAKCRWGCYWDSVEPCTATFEPPPPAPTGPAGGTERPREEDPEQKSAK
jgi:hypothetical protein